MTDVKKQVENLKKKYGTLNPEKLCKLMDIEVLIVPLPNKIRGFFLNVMGHDFIYVNDTLSEIDKKIVISHELGHTVLHSKLNFVYMSTYTLMATSKYEKEADYFASCMLLEDKLFFNEYYEVMTLEEISLTTGIPLYYVELRWQNLTNKLFLC